MMFADAILQRCRADGAGRKTDLSRRLVAVKRSEDGNLMKADGNSFPEFILGWTIGAIGVLISIM
jgi:hypothetical protein